MKKIITTTIKFTSYIKRALMASNVFWMAAVPTNCKFHPSCSEYTVEAIETFGVFKGGIKGFWRVLRCNPFSKGGIDNLT